MAKIKGKEMRSIVTKGVCVGLLAIAAVTTVRSRFHRHIGERFRPRGRGTCDLRRAARPLRNGHIEAQRSRRLGNVSALADADKSMGVPA